MKRGAIRKSWKKRQFDLTFDGIRYYGKDRKKGEKGGINISDFIEVMEAEANRLPQGMKKQNHHFVLVCTERDLHLAAASKAEMDDWIKSIQQAQARRKEVRRQKKGIISRASRVLKKSSFSAAKDASPCRPPARGASPRRRTTRTSTTLPARTTASASLCR